MPRRPDLTQQPDTRPRGYRDASQDLDRTALGSMRGMLPSAQAITPDQDQYDKGELRWAVCLTDIAVALGNTTNFNLVACCHCDDRSGAGMDEANYFDVYLPTGGCDPNVRADTTDPHVTDAPGDADVIPYMFDPATGDRICMGDYGDHYIGEIIWSNIGGVTGAPTTGRWGNLTSADFEDGWRGWYLCDGDNTTPDLRTRFIMAVDPANSFGDQTEDSVGDIGGFRGHNAAENNHDDHTYTQVVGGTGANALPTPQVHTNTDNRPRYYVLAALIRKD